MGRAFIKYTVILRSNRPSDDGFETLSIRNEQTNENWDSEHIEDRGVVKFQNLDDVKKTLNWNLNGDEELYKQKWLDPYHLQAEIWDHN